jgi:hypothetical protein
VSSGHGIGKSALCAFVTKWALGTCPDARVVITANTESQLSTKTSPELSKWFRLAIDSHAWNPRTTSITSKDPSSERTWRCDLIPWNESSPESFAGLHNQGRIIVVVFDEASAIADCIFDTTMGALTDENTIIIWLVFGNPTLPTGRFAECFGSKSAYWVRKQIDSRSVEGTNKEEIARWAQERGEDSDFFRVRVRGEFPVQGNAQFISQTCVEQARRAKYEIESGSPKILVCDPARFGEDETVIGLRQGRTFTILEHFREKPTDFTGERVIHWMQKGQSLTRRAWAPVSSITFGPAGSRSAMAIWCTASTVERLLSMESSFITSVQKFGARRRIFSKPARRFLMIRN